MIAVDLTGAIAYPDKVGRGVVQRGGGGSCAGNGEGASEGAFIVEQEALVAGEKFGVVEGGAR